MLGRVRRARRENARNPIELESRMRLLESFALLIIAAAVFSFLNTSVLKLPTTIGLLLSGLAASAVILAVNTVFPALDVTADARRLIGQIDFGRFLFRGALSFLLFAGALRLNIDDIRREKVPVAVLAFLGVVLSAAIVGFASYAAFPWLGARVPLAYALAFGALISPTDPIAVIGILESRHVPKTLQTRMTGESLFNDGLSVVVFSVLLTMAEGGGVSGGRAEFLDVALLLGREVIGGAALGLGIGLAAYAAMKRIDEPNVEVLLSFGLVAAIMLAAAKTGVSAPLACVMAGLLIGNRGRRVAMKEATRDALDQIWSFVDALLNAMLFLLLGLEALFLWSEARHALSLLLLVPVVIAARGISVGAGIAILGRRYKFGRGSLAILTWGGLRGGISLAMALSLPHFPGRSEVLIATYGIAVFSIVVQGLTLGPMTRHVLRQRQTE